ncbi:DEAD/DEAH box helicase [Profundibacterium mesophilum]|uniref:ATP-dependent RNA helicase RhlE n=1 Tax=Profundibacterium mesophilum KAUST100406-0324 TaxID=1037889 RepID=A0A921NQN8_9RHOB|nr:DEAD/DEAH box helicase [Profundibacterium mesophilum]KAF0675527.1 ATP-dependent RNA helicase RhlE [Profundibacterium mesophilum KAUST100406-0324]
MDFDMLGLSPKLVARLAEQGITEPTPIQKQAIPHAMNGRDVMGLAQTGTGKTAAFGLPLIHALTTEGTKPAPKTARGLILAPTRELANQIAENLRSYTGGSHLSVAIVVGGVSINRQINRLERGVDLLVATPGRLIDLLDRRAVRLDETRFLVLDEADQMLDMGFIHALRKIAPLLAPERQTMLFSATMPKLMNEIAQAYLDNPVRVEVSPPGKVADKVTQEVHFLPKEGKQGKLVELLQRHREERALVFARTKHGAERLMKQLDRAGFAAASIHGNKSQNQRDRAITDFKSAKIRVLVATDVAARGIDIPGVEYVYNFDLPNVPENYVHRIGRTARAGRAGEAIAFCAPDEMGDLRGIEKVMKLSIPVASGAPWAEAEAPAKSGRGGAGNRRRRSSGGAGGGGGGRRSGGGRRAA